MAGTARFGSVHFYLGKLRHYLQTIHDLLSLSGRERRGCDQLFMMDVILRNLNLMRVIYPHVLKSDTVIQGIEPFKGNITTPFSVSSTIQ